MSTESSNAGRLLAGLVAAMLLGGAVAGVAAGSSAGATASGSAALSLEESTDSLEDTTNETTDDLENTTDEETTETVNETAETVDDTVSETTETADDTVSTTETVDETTEKTTGAVDDAVSTPTDFVDGEPGTAGNDSSTEGTADNASEGENASDGGDAGGPPGPTETTTDAVLVGLLGAITASGAVAGGAGASGAAAGGAGATGSASSATTGWLRRLRHLGDLRRAGADLPWTLLPVFRYSRYDDSDPLEHDRRRAIYEAIRDRPGRYLSEVSERTDVPLSTVRYHVGILEEEDLVTGRKVNGKRRYFLEDADAELQAALAEPAKRTLLETLADLDQAPNGRLAEALDRDPSTISHHLAALEDDGLVVRERDGRSIVNELPARVETALSGPDSEAESRPAPADD